MTKKKREPVSTDSIKRRLMESAKAKKEEAPKPKVERRVVAKQAVNESYFDPGEYTDDRHALNGQRPKGQQPEWVKLKYGSN